MNEKRNININIAGVPMNITVRTEEEEEHYRRAAKEINQRVLEYKSRVGVVEGENNFYLAGVCLEYKLKLIKQTILDDELNVLLQELDEVIS
ncbi:MAG: cell division protein ZapA [Marinifilaceae bacterium]